MKDRFTAFLFLLFVAVAVSGLSGQDEIPSGPWGPSPRPDVSDQTALKIIDLHIKARGGQQALMDIKGIRMDGMLKEGQGVRDYKIESLHRRPNALMVKTSYIHMGDDYVSIQVTDGQDTWKRELLPKRKSPAVLGGNDKASLEIDARLAYLFLDAESSENTYAYMGESKFYGQPAYVIRVWMNNGDQIEALFDTTTFHIINYRQEYRIGPQQVLIDRVPTGLMRVENTWWDKGYSFRIRGKSFREISFEKIWFTPLPPMDTFKRPVEEERWLRG